MKDKYTIPIGNGFYITPKTEKALTKLNYMNPFWLLLIFTLVFGFAFFKWWQTFIGILFCQSLIYYYYKKNYPDAVPLFEDVK